MATAPPKRVIVAKFFGNWAGTLAVVHDLHPDIACLASLIGTWVGEGTGEYPTIDPFSYVEEVTFSQLGKPFLTYSQRTRSGVDGKPLHVEVGYLRVPSPGRIEFVLAHPTGITEIEEGTLSVSDKTVVLDMNSTSIGLTASAKDVKVLSRSIRIEGDELSYTLRMGAVGHIVQHHLSATLHRTAG